MSRNVTDLHPHLQEAWNKAQVAFKEKYPNLPQPILSYTYRSIDEQNALYAQGRTKPGVIVTRAKGGQSPHNYLPALAFDIAFVKPDKSLDWNLELFKLFAAILSSDTRVTWGGSWKGFQDNPHFEMTNWITLIKSSTK